ncbi:MAG: hypothetical protein GY765_32210 [bacterium]|nr:hypothetical protein [bacterium]
MMTDKEEVLDSLFESKRQHRKDQAKLPFEEKIEILVKLQQIARDIAVYKKGKTPLLPVWQLD